MPIWNWVCPLIIVNIIWLISSLNILDISDIRLMTNNPAKIKSLEFYGIEVEERISLIASTNPEK